MLDMCVIEFMFQNLEPFCNNVYVWSIVVHHKPFDFVDIKLQVIVIAPCDLLSVAM